MPEHDTPNDRGKPPREIKFEIDGKTYTTTDREQPAKDLITLAGLDPAQYDLAELHGDHEKPPFADDEIVKINPNDKFVTVRVSAPVG
jgi:hypothetical protein